MLTYTALGQPTYMWRLIVSSIETQPTVYTHQCPQPYFHPFQPRPITLPPYMPVYYPLHCYWWVNITHLLLYLGHFTFWVCNVFLCLVYFEHCWVYQPLITKREKTRVNILSWAIRSKCQEPLLFVGEYVVLSKLVILFILAKGKILEFKGFERFL